MKTTEHFHNSNVATMAARMGYSLIPFNAESDRSLYWRTVAAFILWLNK